LPKQLSNALGLLFLTLACALQIAPILFAFVVCLSPQRRLASAPQTASLAVRPRMGGVPESPRDPPI
jgi:hypothetical protein